MTLPREPAEVFWQEALATKPEEHSLIEVRDVWSAAQLLVTHYGPHAATRAAERADELRQAGDIIGTVAWQRILGAVEDLQRDRRQGESRN